MVSSPKKGHSRMAFAWVPGHQKPKSQTAGAIPQDFKIHLNSGFVSTE